VNARPRPKGGEVVWARDHERGGRCFVAQWMVAKTGRAAGTPFWGDLPIQIALAIP